MKETDRQLELTRPERQALGEVQKGSPLLYASIVSIVASTFLAIQRAVNAADVIKAVNNMLDDTETRYNIAAITGSSSEIAINRTRFFICCLANRLLLMAFNFPCRATEKAAA